MKKFLLLIITAMAVCLFSTQAFAGAVTYTPVGAGSTGGIGTYSAILAAAQGSIMTDLVNKANTKIDPYSDLGKMATAFSDSGAYSSQMDTFAGYQGYKYFGIAFGQSFALTLPCV